MSKKIKLELFTDYSDCPDCGWYSMECFKITSSNKRLNTRVGSADCCNLERADVLDAIIFLDEELDLNLPLSEEAKSIMEKHSFSLKEANENYLFEIVNEDYSERYVEIFDLTEYNGNVILMLNDLLLEKGYDFSFSNKTKSNSSSYFNLS